MDVREVMVDSSRFFVFQDVCKAHGRKVCFADLLKVSEKNKHFAKMSSDRPRKDSFVLLNAAGVTELLETMGLKRGEI